MAKVVNMGITIPKEMLQFVDENRGDVKRSTFVTRMLEHSLSCKNENSGNGSGLVPCPTSQVSKV